MSIGNYKFSDEDISICYLDTNKENISLINERSEESRLNKQDAIVIAKHFNQDRESLVSSIKELLVGCIVSDAHRLDGDNTDYNVVFRDKVKKLIEGGVMKEDINLNGETASQVGLRADMERRHCYHAAGEFLESANARTLHGDLSEFLYETLFKSKLDK